MSKRTPLSTSLPLLVQAQQQCAAAKIVYDAAKTTFDQASTTRNDLLKSDTATDAQITAADNARDVARNAFTAAENSYDNARAAVEAQQNVTEQRQEYLQGLKDARVPATQLATLAENCQVSKLPS